MYNRYYDNCVPPLNYSKTYNPLWRINVNSFLLHKQILHPDRVCHGCAISRGVKQECVTYSESLCSSIDVTASTHHSGPHWKKKKSWVYYMWIMETQGAKGTYNHKLVSKWLGGYIFTLFSVLLLNFSSLRPRGCMRKIDSLPISVAASTDSLDAPRCSRQITQRRLIVWWRTAFTCCICFHGISCAAANAEWKMLTLDEWRQSPGPAARESPTPAPGGGGRLWYTKEQFTSHMRQSRPSHSGASPLRSTWSYH